MFTTMDAFGSTARPRSGDRVVGSPWTSGRIVGAVVVGAAVLAGVSVRQPALLLALLAPVAAVLAYWWIRLLVHRDARSLVLLWPVFATNQTAALLLPESLSGWALRVDDLSLAVALGVILVTGLLRRDLRLPGRLLMVGVTAFAAAGVLSALVAHTAFATVALGTWLSLKLWVCVALAWQFSWTERDIAWARRIVVGVVVVVLVVAAVQVLAPALVSDFFGSKQRSRIGGAVITSIFREPYQYSVFMLLAVSLVLSAARLRFGRGSFGVVAAGFALLSLRLKALVDVLLMLFAAMATSSRRVVRVWAPATLVGLGSVALYLGRDLVADRISVLVGGARDSPRQILYRTAVAIADSGFPLGSGFGTFGSEASRADYSRVYVEYGLSAMYGFSEKVPSYLTDASWATVLGEAGWIGAAGFVVALVTLVLGIARRAGAGATMVGEDPSRAALLFLVAFIADSVTSPQLFSGFACISLATLASLSLSVAAQRERSGGVFTNGREVTGVAS